MNSDNNFSHSINTLGSHWCRFISCSHTIKERTLFTARCISVRYRDETNVRPSVADGKFNRIIFHLFDHDRSIIIETLAIISSICNFNKWSIKTIWSFRITDRNTRHVERVRVISARHGAATVIPCSRHAGTDKNRYLGESIDAGSRIYGCTST